MLRRTHPGVNPDIIRTSVTKETLDSITVCESSIVAHPSISAWRTMVSYRSYIGRDVVLENLQSEYLPGERQHYERSRDQH